MHLLYSSAIPRNNFYFTQYLNLQAHYLQWRPLGFPSARYTTQLQTEGAPLCRVCLLRQNWDGGHAVHTGHVSVHGVALVHTDMMTRVRPVPATNHISFEGKKKGAGSEAKNNNNTKPTESLASRVSNPGLRCHCICTARYYYTTQIPPVLHIPECSAGSLEHQLLKDAIIP